jgi:hypothetical protein
MATLTPNSIVATGLTVPAFSSPGSGGDTFANDGRTFLEARTAGTASTVTTNFWPRSKRPSRAPLLKRTRRSWAKPRAGFTKRAGACKAESARSSHPRPLAAGFAVRWGWTMCPMRSTRKRVYLAVVATLLRPICALRFKSRVASWADVSPRG